MAMKKAYVILAMIALLALFSYAYLLNQYNHNTVEFYYNGMIMQDNFERIRSYNKGSIAVADFIMPYQGNKLIMTTGLDFLTEAISMDKGGFISDISRREAAIGDRAADKYFKNGDVIGKYMDIYGKSYEIKGVIKNSNEIYISYDSGLEDLNWGKKVIKYNLNDDAQFYLEINKIRGQLNALGLDIYDVVIIKEIIYKYMNMLILIGISVLTCFGIRFFRHFVKQIKNLLDVYMESKNTAELRDFLMSHVRDILRIIGWLPVISAVGLGIYALVTDLYIPPAMMPENLFSPSSYIRVMMFYYDKFVLHIENGVSGILLEAYMLDSIFILGFFLLFSLGWKIKSPCDKIFVKAV